MPVHLHLEISLDLLNVVYDGLLLLVQMGYGVLVLTLYHVYNLLRLLDHSVVLIIHFLHPHDIVVSSLFGESDALLDLLLSAVLEQKEILLECLYFVLQFLDRLLMGREIKFDVLRFPKGLMNDIFL